MSTDQPIPHIDMTQPPYKKKRLTQKQIAEKFIEFFAAHDNCQKKQVGACVYCVDHNIRLYQGEL